MLIPEAFLFTYFSYVAGYTLLLSGAGRFMRPLRLHSHPKKSSIAILIPAYKEDAVIFSVAAEAVKQNYPSDKFKVIVIADSLQPETIQKLKTLPVKLVEVSFEKSTKVKALNAALSHYTNRQFDMGLILDADNLMENNFLEKINAAWQQGFRAIQGQRIARNKNTNFAVLDALSEIINNHIYRKGTWALRGASSLIGSGMAFDFEVLKNTLQSMSSVGGFDRELEVLLLEKGIKSCYLENARVLDEKTEKADVFASQRKRWIASQFRYLKKYFGKGIKALVKGKWAYANSALLRNIQLPRVINIGLLFITCLLSLLFSSFFTIKPLYWCLLLGAMGIAFVLAVPLKFYNKAFFRALYSLPKAFGIMLLLLFRLKGADKTFIHTPHSGTESTAR